MLAAMPPEFKESAIEMDGFLKSLRPLKFKRTVDKRKINYVSAEYGISYAILPLDEKPTQHFGWYYLHNKETGEWYRKTDYFIQTLADIAKSDSEAAKRIFGAINNCRSCKGNPCAVIAYTYDGEDKLACYGRVILELNPIDFSDAKLFFTHLNTQV